MGVRSFVKSESTTIVVTQRLKRMPTILDKLGRHPNMKITQMQDIGGCRAILEEGSRDVRGVLRRINRNWNVRKVDDYCEVPKPRTGYRAVHVVVERDERLVEIQLRTPNQHRWAVEIEGASARLGMPRLKDGEGPDELVRYFELAGHLFAVEDGDEDADRDLLDEFRNLRGAVGPYFSQPRNG
jgi:hypothetical protein